MGQIYIVGAGLSGLSCAVALAAKGVRATVLEASAQAGGRCRSYHDAQLDMVIDNGNHFILSGNAAVFGYLRAIGSADRVTGPRHADLDFIDFRDGARWTIRPNDGPTPWWVLSSKRRVAGTAAAEYLALAPLVTNRDDRRVDALVACTGPLWERLIEPFLVGALNTNARAGSAALAGAVLRQSLARGGRAYRVRIAHPTLAAAFVDPALKHLAAAGSEVRFGAAIRSMVFDDSRLVGIELPDERIDLDPGDTVIMAVPPWMATSLLPGLIAPEVFNPIVNAHFKVIPPPGASTMLGVIGGTAEWIFAFPDRLSVTVSNAEHLVDQDRETLARAFWSDIARVYDLPATPPPCRIVKERRATFAATPEQNARRPGAATRWSNLILAGDWTDTGLPATIEGSVRSGNTAAALALQSRRGV